MKTTLALIFSIIFSSLFAQWEWQNPYPQGNHLFGLQFLNENEGWAVGDFGSIIHTENGGETWEQSYSGYSKRLREVYFYNSNKGWAEEMLE